LKKGRSALFDSNKVEQEGGKLGKIKKGRKDPSDQSRKTQRRGGSVT